MSKRRTTQHGDDHHSKRVRFEHVHLAQRSQPPASTTHHPHRDILLSRQHRLAARRPGFSLITALCAHADILHHLMRHLSPREIINLYSISLPFHIQFSSNYTSFILSACVVHAPDAPRILPWRAYAELCIDDPALRARHSSSGPQSLLHNRPYTSLPANTTTIAPVPSLRYLSFAAFTHILSLEIPAYLCASGHPLPASTPSSIRKLQHLLHIPLTAPRIALIRNTSYFTHFDLTNLHALFVKLDMAVTDPVAFTGAEPVLRKFLLQAPSISAMWDFLRLSHDRVFARVDVLRLWVQNAYVPPLVRGPHPETKAVQAAWDDVDAAKVMGVPLRLCGRGGHELRGHGRERLLRPDELVVLEGTRRGLGLERFVVRMMRLGALDGELKARRRVQAEEVVWSLVRRGDKRAERERKGREERERVEELVRGLVLDDVD